MTKSILSSSHKLVYVEDDADWQRSICTYIREAGRIEFEDCLYADNLEGAEAELQTAAGRIVLIMDLRLGGDHHPNYLGYQWLLDNLEGFIKRNSSTLIFVISGQLHEGIRESLRRRGVPDHHMFDKGDWADERTHFLEILQEELAEKEITDSSREPLDQDSQDTLPFIYADFLHEMTDLICRPTPVVIWAGRGLGKTMFLKRLYQTLTMTEGSRFIRGRSIDALERLQQWADSPSGHLFLDDFDQLRPQNAQRTILELLPARPHDRIAMTIRHPSTAPSLHNIEKFRLDPWQGDWPANLAQAITLGIRGPRSSSRPVPIDGQALAIWIDVICDLTGGHPALAHPAFRYLKSLLNDHSKGSKNPADLFLSLPREVSPQTWESTLRVHLEDFLVDRALPLIQETVRDLGQNRPNLFRDLAKLAKDHEYMPDVFTRRELRDTGLVYTNPAGKAVIASPLVENWIRRVEEKREISPENPLVAETFQFSQRIQIELTGSDCYSGVLQYTVDNGSTINLPITGAPWRLLRSLFDAQGEPLSISDLSDAANLGSETAVRSALQRLHRWLKENRLENVVLNVRGLGYRFGTFPILRID